MTYSNHLPVTRPKSFTAPLWRGIIVQEASNTFLPTWAQLGWPNQWSLLVSFSGVPGSWATSPLFRRRSSIWQIQMLQGIASTHPIFFLRVQSPFFVADATSLHIHFASEKPMKKTVYHPASQEISQGHRALSSFLKQTKMLQEGHVGEPWQGQPHQPDQPADYATSEPNYFFITCFPKKKQLFGDEFMIGFH